MKPKIIAFLFLLIPSLALSQLHRIGLLTNDYGIVTKQDLDEDEAQCTEAESFPPHSGCMMYWQCLSTQDVRITCETLGRMSKDSTERYGEFTLTIKDRGETHEYQGRHNNDIAYCQATKRAMLKVMAHEKIVCISGEFGEKDDHESYWIIDRMKSHHGEWSWFQREKRQMMLNRKTESIAKRVAFSEEERVLGRSLVDIEKYAAVQNFNEFISILRECPRDARTA